MFRIVRRLLLVGMALALPATGWAQEAVITGTLTDSTGGVLPGVTVTAVHEATGNTFFAVTDGIGRYRIPARIGGYRLTAELPGFTTVERTGVQLLVGQTANINLQMTPSTIQETVTVTAEAPLLETATSDLGGNIDSLQMSDLPVQGRDWTSLALLAPGNRTTAMGGQPVQDSRHDNREYQLNMDGQQVTNNLGTGEQPRFSRDAIAEFQFISNRFDATQGRSSGVQVNAITKSGTNAFSGSFAGYFRNSDWPLNEEDHVLNRIVPYENQQYSATVGGPILRDRFHFFANYEYDRTPSSTFSNTAWPAFNIELSGLRTVKMGGVRLDYQLSPQNRLMFKGNLTKRFQPFDNLGSNHPAATGTTDATEDTLVLQLTQVFGSRALNEVKVAYGGLGFAQANLSQWSNHWQARNGVTSGHPRITFRGFSVGGNSNYPRYRWQNNYSVRDDFTISYTARGRHDMRAGGEFILNKDLTNNCSRCMGQIDARGGPVPENIEQILAVWNDASTWDLAALSPIVRRYNVGVGTFGIPMTMPKLGAWVQDDWHTSDRLTLNLGLRYDYIHDSFGQYAELLPWQEAGRPQDVDNIQPRLGFAYQLNDRTVLRGGAGKYYADTLTVNILWPVQPSQVAIIGIDNDGRPDFAANPFNGPLPTFDQANRVFCHTNGGAPGCLFRDAPELAAPPDYSHITQKWQTSIGVQRQMGTHMAVEADYVYSRGTDEKTILGNANLSYDPATGANIPFSNEAARPFPLWGVVGMTPHTGWSNYHGLQTALTKRMSDNWQASVTYTLSGYWTGDPLPISGLREVTFDVPPDLGDDYSLAPTDQRHRIVFNGIWQVGYGFQLSGLYFFGSGERDTISSGAGDLRDLGDGPERLRADGTIVPRGSFVGDPIHRVDLRLQQRIPVGGRVSIDGIMEMFNLFNRANFGSYETEESSPRFGLPNSSSNLAYAPRTLQLGFRLTF